mmetsp:Transcript_48693/g.96897  ORF Transcript_48693/g.96897 Transcript_48693/m.96897 type:complete len:226 (-) Transcript_48693:15-692(-)
MFVASLSSGRSCACSRSVPKCRKNGSESMMTSIVRMSSPLPHSRDRCASSPVPRSRTSTCAPRVWRYASSPTAANRGPPTEMSSALSCVSNASACRLRAARASESLRLPRRLLRAAVLPGSVSLPRQAPGVGTPSRLIATMSSYANSTTPVCGLLPGTSAGAGRSQAALATTQASLTVRGIRASSAMGRPAAPPLMKPPRVASEDARAEALAFRMPPPAARGRAA